MLGQGGPLPKFYLLSIIRYWIRPSRIVQIYQWSDSNVLRLKASQGRAKTISPNILASTLTRMILPSNVLNGKGLFIFSGDACGVSLQILFLLKFVEFFGIYLSRY